MNPGWGAARYQVLAPHFLPVQKGPEALVSIMLTKGLSRA